VTSEEMRDALEDVLDWALKSLNGTDIDPNAALEEISSVATTALNRIKGENNVNKT